MRHMWIAAVLAALTASPALFAQAKPADPKKDDPAKPTEAKRDDPKADPKKDDPKTPDPKVKDQLPTNWSQLGLTDTQKQEVYKIRARHNEEIDKLEAKIKELKETMTTEQAKVLTDEQKKRLEEILKKKAGTDKKDK